MPAAVWAGSVDCDDGEVVSRMAVGKRRCYEVDSCDHTIEVFHEQLAHGTRRFLERLNHLPTASSLSCVKKADFQ